MGTKNTVRLIDTAGTSYYLSGGGASQTTYSGSGTPWTAESTSPYELSLNDVTPIWVPQPAPAIEVYSGGPPFRNGRGPLYRSFDTITEQVGIQMRATTKDNAIFLLRQLRQILNTALFTLPCILAVQGGTNTGYTEIYHADAPETVSYLSEPDGIFRATITWTRHPHFGILSTGETLLNAVAFTNTGTGTPDNIAPYSTGTGDLIYDGQPLNILLQTTGGATSLEKAYLASISSRAYSATSAGAYSTTNTTTGVDNQVDNPSIAAALTNYGLKCRVMMRFSAMTSNARIKLKASMTSNFFVGNEIDPDNNATIVDMGEIPLDVFRQMDTSTNMGVVLNVRSTDGANATATFSYVETILYYDWCVASGNATTDKVRQFGFTEVSGRPCLPKYPERLAAFSGSTPINSWVYAGTPPRYFSGASLYLAWIDNAHLHDTTDTVNATATHAPLYTTLRGST